MLLLLMPLLLLRLEIGNRLISANPKCRIGVE